MSVARHHAEWLSLVEISGPFLSLPVLLRVFPQQLDALDAGVSRDTRLAFAEWEDAEGDRAVHHAWLQFVLKRILSLPDEVLFTDQAIPPGMEFTVAEHGETLRPQWVVKRAEDERAALLVVAYPVAQELDRTVNSARWQASPATRMLALLQGTGVPLGLVTNGSHWMLVSTRPGEPATYVTWDAALWSEEPLTLRAFSSLVGSMRLFGVAERDCLPALLAESAQNQQEVTDQLGLQVRKAVEVLVQAVDRINADRNGQLLTGMAEKELYQAALTVMMRLVFVLSAEERGLLLLGDPLWNRHYAVSTLRDQLREVPDENLLAYRHDAWSRLLSTFRAIHAGVEHDQMRLPAYGGALFDPDRIPFLEGREPGTHWQEAPAQPLPVSNRTVLHLLEALQFLQMRIPGGGVEPRRLSFRALDIEQIGHVYEGLLDHTARRAASTVLGLRGSGGDDVEVELSVLEGKAAESEQAVVNYLKERTGRTPSALRSDLRREEPPNALALQAVCAGHDGLFNRIARFAHLLRDDFSGHPVVIHPGSVYVTKGSDRRNTSTHYTPRTLTEEVVKATLDPLLYTGVSQGAEPSLETLKTPTEILALKVCDPACGSGAFLVQACRYMAERVVEGWAKAEAESGDNDPLTVPEALSAGASHSQQLLPPEPEERLALARRLVAERCLYGVDLNPMAVEMAKLSLWLVTLHKHRPFTFLDHAIKCGDSLLGLHDPAQLERFHLAPSRTQTRVVDYLLTEVQELLAEARRKREALERFTALDVRDAELKARLHREAEASLAIVRVLADLIVGAALSTAGSNADRSAALLDARLEELLLQAGTALAPAVEQRFVAEGAPNTLPWPLRQSATQMLGTANGSGEPRRPFHWLVEFPEVFMASASGGFDALVGNPPFVGGQKITGLFGTDYRDHLVLHLAAGRRGTADLCAYFFLRAVQVLRLGGAFGLLAVNTIAEGDTRQVGLEAMLRQGITLYTARTNFEWPGAASVVASAVQGLRGAWNGIYRLNGSVVPFISAFLTAEDEWSPMPLQANASKSFVGSYVLGIGFTISPEEAQELIARDERNAEALFPYVNGEDLNTHPQQQASRWVINFWDWPLDRSADDGLWAIADERRRLLWLRDGRVPPDYPGRVASDFPDLLTIVEREVKPERQRVDKNGQYVLRKPMPQRWWHYSEKRPALYHAIGRGRVFARHPEGWSDGSAPMSQVTVFAQTSKTKYPHLVDNEAVFDQKVVVIASSDLTHFAVLSSSFHYAWVHVHGSRMKTDAVYTPSDVYETFPFPAVIENSALKSLGRELHEFRQSVLEKRVCGLTRLYKLVHSPSCTDADVETIRRIHREIDHEVACAYGWSDVLLDHGFHVAGYIVDADKLRYTVSEAARVELMHRLSTQNRKRYREELEAAPSVDAVQAERSTPLKRAGRPAAKKAAAPSVQPQLFE
ncbi:Eco57I restriction-modification methylase domain-containing protein [Ralstonia pseudosolanacearum]|uniref:Eco57I restriction-modification methylase domain-containing protein n=1 Tax=Ralstonia pseudosolanacearum TaxID=1310165 RepID=UPI002676E8DF|nr:DNA methyltransferase [Ralstonia pseudosolanacearum]MDO3523974.1 ATP phosphoribosyltransferase regulatory subunit [Ralstonia pseudosolanacearum]MDO3548363.1 ATP phosphoribosyltransferase regulatory subunit [Ralstonia pseudosolanacearum]MDO3553417.1 ATP phosphoribosyltransferase regulatory subunit [Ralstonia pseudosolanacearum]MDO3567277.1 ATP phosphoribosyltransferase regulatory subunit [Ralstonia pseudosolanacearum]MDO3582829.1 ATP phosphoribosyltransferase regulatory subunit [Ralstonia ps